MSQKFLSNVDRLVPKSFILIYIWRSSRKREIQSIKNPIDKIIAYRAVGLDHTDEGPESQEECVYESDYDGFSSSSSSCKFQEVKVNQWLETDYNYGDAFDMNYFTAPYNGLYQFYVHIKLRSDTTSYIYMNSLIYFLTKIVVWSTSTV